MLPDTVPLVLVAVIRRRFNDDGSCREEPDEPEFMVPMLAMQELLSKENGTKYCALRIVPPEGYSMGHIDASGGGFAAEWGKLKFNQPPDPAGEITWKD